MLNIASVNVVFKLGVEDELHFVLLCPVYAEARLKLLHVLEWYCNDYNLVLPDNEEAYVV